MATFSDLPIEMKERVFLELPISELLRCKQVCKEWRAFIDSLRYRSLRIVKQNPFHFKYRNLFVLRYKYDPIKTDYHTDCYVHLKTAESLSGLQQEPIFQNVKKMITFFTNLSNYDVLTNFFNNFQKLEELSIFSNYLLFISNTGSTWKIFLDLKLLRKLTVDSKDFQFHLKTPNLSSVKMIRNLFYRFEFPEKLKFLEVDNCEIGTGFPNLFTNLKTLVIQKSLKVYDDDFLRRMPSLEELFFGFNYPQIRQLTARLDKEQTPAIFVYGMNLQHFQRLSPSLPANNELPENKIKHSQIGKKTKFFIKNLSSLRERNYCEFELDFNKLARLESENFDEFSRKVERVSIVTVDNRVVDQERLLKFLKEKRPFHLKISIYKFKPAFMERLPGCCQSLREIHLVAKEGEDFPNLDFIFKMKNLARIDISNAFSMGFVIKTFEMESLWHLIFWTKSYIVYMTNGFVKHELRLIRLVKGDRLDKCRKKGFSSKEMFLGRLKEIQTQLDDSRPDQLLNTLEPFQPAKFAQLF